MAGGGEHFEFTERIPGFYFPARTRFAGPVASVAIELAMAAFVVEPVVEARTAVAIAVIPMMAELVVEAVMPARTPVTLEARTAVAEILRAGRQGCADRADGGSRQNSAANDLEHLCFPLERACLTRLSYDKAGE